MPRLMLVDYERSVLSSLRRAIQAVPSNMFDGAMIDHTFDLPELALARAADCEFDLVISDWPMPSMNQITFLDELIQIQPTRWTRPIGVELNHALLVFDAMRSKLFGKRWWTRRESAKPSRGSS